MRCDDDWIDREFACDLIHEVKLGDAVLAKFNLGEPVCPATDALGKPALAESAGQAVGTNHVSEFGRPCYVLFQIGYSLFYRLTDTKALHLVDFTIHLAFEQAKH